MQPPATPAQLPKYASTTWYGRHAARARRQAKANSLRDKTPGERRVMSQFFRSPAHKSGTGWYLAERQSLVEGERPYWRLEAWRASGAVHVEADTLQTERPALSCPSMGAEGPQCAVRSAGTSTAVCRTAARNEHRAERPRASTSQATTGRTRHTIKKTCALPALPWSVVECSGVAGVGEGGFRGPAPSGAHLSIVLAERRGGWMGPWGCRTSPRQLCSQTTTRKNRRQCEARAGGWWW